jgi:hypothetical protein
MVSNIIEVILSNDIYGYMLVGGMPTPLKNMKVNGKDDNPYGK